MDLDVVIITNSPGELSSWVRVTVEKVRSKAPDARIVVMLVPCPYASGREVDIAQSWSEVDMVLSPREFLAHLVGFNGSRYQPARNGVVVFLGGDYWHAVLMSRKLGFPAVAYTDRPSSWGRYFRQVCVADERTKFDLVGAGVPETKVAVVGNLMVEGVRPSLPRARALSSWGLRDDALTVGLFPGSRLYHVQASLSVFLKVAEDLHREVPNVQFALGLSPFLTFDEMRGCLIAQPPPYLEGSHGRLVEGEGGLLYVNTDAGLKIPVLQKQQYDLMNHCDLLLTIPGTNTAEIACLGRPMVVAMSWRARIPRGGIGALLGALPMASMLRRELLKGILRKIKYTALPNQIAQREIVPEVRVEHEPAEISRVAADLLKCERRRVEMSSELRAVMGGHGASNRIADIILDACRPVRVEVPA
jgi:lipid-A-disaccharide synthase